MDVFYEESSIARDSIKESRKYKILSIISAVFLTLGIIAIIFGISFIPLDATWILWGFFCAWLFLAWFLFKKWKQRYNVSYDYCFVSGELRISKVINVNKRRLVARFEGEDFIQIGDADNPSYERFRQDPTIKTVFCTSNDEAADGKFFMYILANYNGKKLFVLECREELLMHILKFVKRSTLESDYVMQERKQR